MNPWMKRASVVALAAACLMVPTVPMSSARAGNPPALNAPKDQSEKSGKPDQDIAKLDQTIANKAFEFLKSKQNKDYGWGKEDFEPGITALVLRAFVADSQFDPDDAFLDKGFDKLLSFQNKEGGIYVSSLACYNTAIALSALATSKEVEYKPAIEKAVAYLKQLQFNDTVSGADAKLKVELKDPRYGGFGYGKHARPDLSNTQMALQALHDAGVKPDDPAYKAALKFVSRSQNLSESNDQSWAGNDGGFIYTPANGGASPAGDTSIDGHRTLRSYGSMTYAGLKSMIYAGLGHDDPRVKAAFDWISKNFTVEENPGMTAEQGQGAVYYYYFTMAEALYAYGQPIITDAKGKKHDWRAELVQKLSELQNKDGSFVGQEKWMEGDPVIVTAYVATVLEYVKQDLKEHPVK